MGNGSKAWWRVRRNVGHSPAQARRTKSLPLARESHDHGLGTSWTAPRGGAWHWGDAKAHRDQTETIGREPVFGSLRHKDFDVIGVLVHWCRESVPSIPEWCPQCLRKFGAYTVASWQSGA